MRFLQDCRKKKYKRGESVLTKIWLHSTSMWFTCTQTYALRTLLAPPFYRLCFSVPQTDRQVGEKFADCVKLSEPHPILHTLLCPWRKTRNHIHPGDCSSLACTNWHIMRLWSSNGSNRALWDRFVLLFIHTEFSRCFWTLRFAAGGGIDHLFSVMDTRTITSKGNTGGIMKDLQSSILVHFLGNNPLVVAQVSSLERPVITSYLPFFFLYRPPCWFPDLCLSSSSSCYYVLSE